MAEITPNQPWHFIRPNEANRYPRRIICFDTEACIKETHKFERQTFRIAVASYDIIDKVTKEPSKSEVKAFVEPELLWEWISSKCKSKSRTVVFAHNLSYDLRISDALRILYQLGFELTFLTLDTNRTVARFKRNGASLILVDLASWFPATLEKIGDKLGIKKVPLPKQDADISLWAKRCTRDVEITRAAVLRLLNWLEVNDLGSFRMTGPAQAMAAYRHRFMPRNGLLVHRDPDALAAERRAVWAGRCEVWQHGEVTGPLYEWDYRLAYLTIAQLAYLPTRLRGSLDEPSLANVLRLSKTRRILADVTVTTECPTIPAKGPDGILWPVGTFKTTLWDNELQLALDYGAKISVSKAWVYMRWPALHDWANWLMAALDTNGMPPDDVMRLMLKDWARSLVGRFGSRWPQWDKVATLPDSKLELLPYLDKETGETGAYLQNGHDWFERSGYVEAPDSMPAVMGYIMAEARCKLWRAIQSVGLENVVYCDTDSIVTNALGNYSLITNWDESGRGNFLCKAEYKRGLFLGPRQIQLNTELRVAGLPKTAIQKGPRSFEAVLWEGLPESIRSGHPSEVRIYRRHVTIKGTDNRRKHMPGGTTVPLAFNATSSLPR
jgi:hypothetical protein